MLCTAKAKWTEFQSSARRQQQWWVDGRGKGEAGACEEENKRRLGLRNTGSPVDSFIYIFHNEGN